MDYLPLFVRLTELPVLLVGGGRMARRKADLLLRAGARVTVVAPEMDTELQTLLKDCNSHWLQRGYTDDCLDGMHMVVVATPHRELNQAISAAAQQRRIPVNVVDTPELCSFVFPAIVDRSPLLVAIGSAGNSPLLVRQVKTQIEALLPAAFGRLVKFAGRFRNQVAEALPDPERRRHFWENLLARPALQQQLDSGNENAAHRTLQELLSSQDSEPAAGEVYLLGAGPGDPDLVTFKAVRLLQHADVVLYDRLVSPQVLDLCRGDAERIYVGKRRSEHTLEQQQINQLLVRLARQGKRVARLKGGDPFIFGRGGEEIELLAENRIPFQVVPGVTAASGCACYAGIPLTHRDHARSVRFITGQLQDGSLDLAWEDLQGEQETLVFYMGLQGLNTICEQLQAHGRASATPIALVEQGTTSHQRTTISTLQEMPELLRNRQVYAPTIIIVGSVVALHAQLSWFEESGTPGHWPPARG